MAPGAVNSITDIEPFNPEIAGPLNPGNFFEAVQAVAPHRLKEVKEDSRELEKLAQDVVSVLSSPDIARDYFQAYFDVVQFRRDYRQKRDAEIKEAGEDVRTYPSIGDYPNIYDEQTFRQTLLNEKHEKWQQYEDLTEKLKKVRYATLEKFDDKGVSVSSVGLDIATVYTEKANLFLL